jgi:Rieske Fe-S protein
MTELDEQHGPGGTSRRTVLLGAGMVGAGAVLAACGGQTPTSGPTTQAGTTQPTTPAASDDPPGGNEGGIKTADVPVGSGIIVADQGAVVTQPTAGQFKAFNATCTHQGCQVARVDANKIVCTCHGSQFNIADGSVANGPALRPLQAKTVTVNGDTLTVS